MLSRSTIRTISIVISIICYSQSIRSQVTNDRNRNDSTILPNQFIWNLSTAACRDSLGVAYGEIYQHVDVINKNDAVRGLAIDLQTSLDQFLDAYDDFQFACLVFDIEKGSSLHELAKLKAKHKLDRIKKASSFCAGASAISIPTDEFLENWTVRTARYSQEAYELALTVSVKLGIK